MKNRDLIKSLLEMPIDAPVCMDTDDKMTGNFQDVRGVRLREANGVPFIVIDADIVAPQE